MQISFVSELLDIEGSHKSRLIPVLNAIQDHYGYLPPEEIKTISREMKISMAKIWGVMTFYSHYKFEPPAKYNVRVCAGTACHVKNSKMLQQKLVSEIDPDTDILIENVACLGCCALAPIFEINGEVHGSMNMKKVIELVEYLKTGDSDNE